MYRDVPGCSGMFRDVPCSWFYRRPMFVGILLRDSARDIGVEFES